MERMVFECEIAYKKNKEVVKFDVATFATQVYDGKTFITCDLRLESRYICKIKVLVRQGPDESTMEIAARHAFADLYDALMKYEYVEADVYNNMTKL